MHGIYSMWCMVSCLIELAVYTSLRHNFSNLFHKQLCNRRELFRSLVFLSNASFLFKATSLEAMPELVDNIDRHQWNMEIVASSAREDLMRTAEWMFNCMNIYAMQCNANYTTMKRERVSKSNKLKLHQRLLSAMKELECKHLFMSIIKS